MTGTVRGTARTIGDMTKAMRAEQDPMSAIDPDGVSLIVIAKAPLPGFAKTRLIPDLGEEGAARVAEASLADTLWAVAEAPAARRILVLDGEPGPGCRESRAASSRSSPSARAGSATASPERSRTPARRRPC